MPIEQQAFYAACLEGNDVLKQSYHTQFYQQTLEALKQHVNYIIDELNDLSLLSWREFARRHPRLPLLERHNEFVLDIFDLVLQNLETTRAL